jgi:hypothetical protein
MGRFLWVWGLCWLLLVGLAATAQAEGLTAIRVCIRPPDVPADIDAWVYAPNGTTVIRMKREDFKKESRGHTVYLFSPSAPPESVKLLPKRWSELKCPPYAPPPKDPPPAPAGAAAPPPPPPPPAGAGAKGEAPKPAEKPPAAAEKKKKAPEPPPQPIVYVNRPPPPEPIPKPPPGGVTEHWPKTVLPVVISAPEAEPKVLPSKPVLPVVRRDDTEQLPMTHGLPMKGGSHGSGDGSGDGTGHGPKKTTADKIAEQLAYAGALASLQLNEDTKRPDGKQFGIVGGKNPNGPNHPAAQAGAGAVTIAAAVLSANADKFMKKAQALYKKALEKGEAKLATLAIKDLEELGEKGAEELAKVYGADIARAMQ